jgi:hypothetical protein
LAGSRQKKPEKPRFCDRRIIYWMNIVGNFARLAYKRVFSGAVWEATYEDVCLGDVIRKQYKATGMVTVHIWKVAVTCRCPKFMVSKNHKTKSMIVGCGRTKLLGLEINNSWKPTSFVAFPLLSAISIMVRCP